jgi:bifunctional enzyme CysN/CysC
LRRSAHVAKLFNDHGLICLAAFVAPNQSVRERVADVIGRDRFLTVHCIADEQERLGRDSKKQSLTSPSVSSDVARYEQPEAPDLVLDSSKLSVAECVQAVLTLLQSKQIIK